MFGRTKTGKGAPGGPGAAAGSGGGGSGGTAAEPRQQQQQQQQGAAAQQATAATLGSGNLRSAVALPEGEDVNEWLAVAAVDFFHQVLFSFLGCRLSSPQEAAAPTRSTCCTARWPTIAQTSRAPR